jgi:SAM-dependent methyltransferase
MTSDYYDLNAEAFRQRTLDCDLAPLHDAFLSRLAPGAHILDAGCGPGRDTLAFLERGFRVTAIDASAAMVELATRATGQPARQLRFEEIELEDSFDGVWANASLVHVPQRDIDDVLCRLARSLRPGGVLHVSVKSGDGERIAPDGRLFCDYTDASLRALFARHPSLRLLSVEESPAQRPQRDPRAWLIALAAKQTATGSGTDGQPASRPRR